MVESVDRLKSNFLFCQQLKDIQFAVIEEERNQKIFTLKKLESDNFDFFTLGNYSNRLSK